LKNKIVLKTINKNEQQRDEKRKIIWRKEDNGHNSVINFNVHGKLSSPASQVELMKEMCHMKAAIATFQKIKWHENREVEIKGLGKIPKDMQKEEQKNRRTKKTDMANIHSKKRKNQETIKLNPSSQF